MKSTLCSSYDCWAQPEKHLAAEVRRLFRSIEAGDIRARDVCHSHFLEFLGYLLERHLRTDSRWGRRWIDDVGGVTEVKLPTWYCVSGDAYWLTDYDGGPEGCGKEPVEFEIDLCPESGAFWRYAYRFGNSRHFESSANSSQGDQSDEGEPWAFIFQEGKQLSRIDEKPADRVVLPERETEVEPDFDADEFRAYYFKSMAQDIAALTRQFFRDVKASDTDAVEVSWFFLRHHVDLMVWASVRDDEIWNKHWLGVAGASPEFRAPGWFYLRDELISKKHGTLSHLGEPLEFEVELAPDTGVLKKLELRFGISRCQEKPVPTPRPSAVPLREQGNWAFLYRFPS